MEISCGSGNHLWLPHSLICSLSQCPWTQWHVWHQSCFSYPFIPCQCPVNESSGILPLHSTTVPQAWVAFKCHFYLYLSTSFRHSLYKDYFKKTQQMTPYQLRWEACFSHSINFRDVSFRLSFDITLFSFSKTDPSYALQNQKAGSCAQPSSSSPPLRKCHWIFSLEVNLTQNQKQWNTLPSSL